MFFIPGNDMYDSTTCMENPVTALQQLSAAPVALGVAVVLRAVLGMGFQSTGGLITKTLGANTWTVMASLVTVPVWIVSLLLGWPPLYLAQVCGFILIVAGNVVYNHLVRVSGLTPHSKGTGGYFSLEVSHSSEVSTLHKTPVLEDEIQHKQGTHTVHQEEK